MHIIIINEQLNDLSKIAKNHKHYFLEGLAHTRLKY